MISDLDWTAVAVIALALLFGYLNGVMNSGSLVAAAIASRSLRPRAALALASVAEVVGPFLFGTAVASTIGANLVRSEEVTVLLVAASLLGALGWTGLAVSLGWPTSASHALVGGLVGAALASGGPQAILPGGLAVVGLGLVVGPILGLVGGYLVLNAVLASVRGASPAVNAVFRRLQAAAVVVLALSHSTNDAQKTMAVIAMVLVGAGAQATFAVPFWAVGASALALALGVATGGSRVIRTLGSRLYRIRPVHGLSAQLSGGLVILAATGLGWPLSTAQVVSAAILGVGAAHRASAVRWQVARSIIVAWVLTIPVAGFAAALAYWLLSRL